MVVEERDSKRPAPRRFGDPNVARMIAAMAASTADTAHDTYAGGGEGGDASPRPRTPRTPSPRRGWTPPDPPLVLRQPTDTTQTGRHLPDELLYPEEFETESENEQENDEDDENEGNEGNETPRERRRLASRGRDTATDKKEDEERRRRRREGKPQTRDPDRPVRRRAPLGPNPHGPHRLERLRACLEAHSLFEGAEKSLLKKAAEDLELVVVPAGSALYKHGAKGDYLYVVEAGTLDVMAPNPSGVGTPRARNERRDMHMAKAPAHLPAGTGRLRATADALVRNAPPPAAGWPVSSACVCMWSGLKERRDCSDATGALDLESWLEWSAQRVV